MTRCKLVEMKRRLRSIAAAWVAVLVLAAACAPAAARSSTRPTEVAYGNDARQRLDVYLPERPNQTLAAPKRNKSEADDEALHQLLRDEPEVEQALFEAYRDDFETFGYPRFKA